MTLSEYFRGKTSVVTGGAGFIGSNLSEALVSLGAKVKVIDDLSTGLKSNSDFLKGLGIEFRKGSILDKYDVDDDGNQKEEWSSPYEGNVTLQKIFLTFLMYKLLFQLI